MTDSHDRVSGARPEDAGAAGADAATTDADAATDPDAMTFFEREAPDRPRAGGATGSMAAHNAGYTGGLAVGNQGAAGMRQVIADELTDQRRDGSDDEPPANLAQQDQ